jgi:hypothetical protein
MNKWFTLFAALLISSFSLAQNPIVTENQNPGVSKTIWDLPSNGDGTYGSDNIAGFADNISYTKGQTINFRIKVLSTAPVKQYDIKIYRLGYYQTNGARFIDQVGGTGHLYDGSAVVQPEPIEDPNNTGLMDYGNWSVTASWTVPSTAVSGLYIARLTLTNGRASHIPFVVRDDASTADIYFKTSDATWQAYNGYGGNSLYVGDGRDHDGNPLANDHASKVSYNRPFVTRNGGGGGGSGEDWLMNAEYPMIRFLEGNGYNISYTTDVDIVRSYGGTNRILQHKVFLSVGHDEYWSKEERDQVEAARAAGVNLAFFSGNEVYWKTRWENSIDGNGTPFRTMVCYKEGDAATTAEKACGGKCDPTSEWTGLWRYGCDAPGGNACKPENALTGEISWDGTTGAMEVPSDYRNLRFWRNTAVANLANGDVLTMSDGTLGYEWDWEQFQSSYPSGRITMSRTDLNGHTHKLSLYRASPGGGLVFGAGTVQWAWGLDANHDNGNAPAERAMQQATINLLADMGAQPDPTVVNLLPGLSRATAAPDPTPPVTAISSPVNGASLPENNQVSISGTATDAGGVVAGVDVSVDGGATWKPATVTSFQNSTTWTFSWTPTALGSVTIMSRGFDDNGNMEAPGGSEGAQNIVNVTVTSGTPPTNCPCSIFTPDQVPAPDETNENDFASINAGVKFKAAFDGKITAIRFYLSSDDNATGHIVQLWDPTNTTTPLAQATQSGALTPGAWNSIALPVPVDISANVVYVATLYSPSGLYSETNYAFLNPVVNGPLTAVADNDDDGDGPNGPYEYADPIYPDLGYEASNYWVDVEYTPNNSGPDTTPPTVLLSSPSNGETNVNINHFVSFTFSENVDPSTVNGTNIQLKDASNNVVNATVSYSAGSRTATLTPTSFLGFSTVYTVTVKAGGVKDLVGNAIAADYVISFTTAPAPSVPSDDGAGGPILVISSNLSAFSRYPVEILRAEGYTAFKAVDITEVRSNPALLNDYDVIILGHMSLNGSDVTTLTNWTSAGGTLIALRPDAALLPLMGVTASGSTLSDKYLLVNTTTGQPGAGIVNTTIQYHGAADLYTLNGASSLATLYSTATAATSNPAITTINVGSNGGKAIAFAYDLSTSIVYTRQGNPAFAGLPKDGQPGPIRSDNLFYPSWIDFNKIQIPQADEQQHLLTNILLLGNLHRKPLPHLWFLPNGYKAAVVMTGDDHNVGSNYGSTETRFNEYMTLGPNTPQDVADWKAIRGTSYVYKDINIPADSVNYFQSQGFEIALHPTTNCTDFTQSSLSSDISSQLGQLESRFPGLNAPVTNRTHCMPWSDWASHAKVESALGIRFDVNYYYWPGAWAQDRPGLFTGSGMPMRFADLDGTIIDCYQAPTQMPDESNFDISTHINTLLNNAITNGYYGVFVMNMHTDQGIHPGSDIITSAAIAKGVPVVSAKQMLTWLDNRNGTVFGPMTWTNSKLSFNITTSAHNLQAMVPYNSADGTLQGITENGSSIPFTMQTVKGITYGVFNANTNSYVASYSSTPLPITLVDFTATRQGNNDALLKWTTSMEENNKGFEIQRSTDAAGWTVIGFVDGAGNSQTDRNYQYTDEDLDAGTYYYRLRQVDLDGKSSISKIAQVTIPGLTLELRQNRPNPLTASTTIEFVIPKTCKAQLILYDQMGRPVQQLVDELKSPGTYQVTVNKNGLSAGTYYYKLNALGKSLVRKMTIL